ncbi:MAG TPA: TRAP transporter substrate-binding protein [Oligella sp.]|nr:TRAP transporter substrate-binding protein [Oligella sp.]
MLKNLLRKRTLAVSLGLCVSLFAGLAQANTVLKAGHASSNTSTGQAAFEFLGKELAEKTNGRITVEIFPNSQLGSERELIESIQLGNVDMAFASSAVLGNFNKEFFALDIPFLFKDRESVYHILDGEIGQQLLESLESVGIKAVAYWENGFRQLTNNKKVILSPEDLKGMKMRTMENEVHIAAWKEIGANPSPLAFGELFTALQQGTFDAQEGPINLFYDMKFYEVQNHITKTNHVYSPWPVMINPDVYNSFSDEDRAIFDEAIKKTTEFQRAQAQEADDKAVADMPNVTITELTPEQLAAFADLMGPVHELVKKRIGADIVDRIVTEANR